MYKENQITKNKATTLLMAIKGVRSYVNEVDATYDVFLGPLNELEISDQCSSLSEADQIVCYSKILEEEFGL